MGTPATRRHVPDGDQVFQSRAGQWPVPAAEVYDEKARTPVRSMAIVDAVLCGDEIQLLDAAGRLLPTRASLRSDGLVLKLQPDRPWINGEHRLVFSKRFEDVCGNRLDEALDHDVSEPGRPRGGTLCFHTRPPATENIIPCRAAWPVDDP